MEARRTLPSFLFLGDQTYVGAYAREQGALVPTKSVHSAKSWLSNPEVDRTAKILPWDAQEGGRVLSPVDVSTADSVATFAMPGTRRIPTRRWRRKMWCSQSRRRSTKKRAS